MNRRNFFKAGTLSAAASGPFLGRILGANERITIGQIGLGARGYYELTLCLRNPQVQVAAVCDVFQPLVDHAVGKVGGKVQGYTDFRRVLDRKDIDAVFVSTPDHWHAPISIMACQAGKDVYCEKPLTHTVAEGRRMVEAAAKYRRVVQTGSQQRSAPHFAKVRDLIQSGHIGKVSFIHCWNAGNEYPEGCGNPPDEAPPPGLDWDMYLGPAPKRPYNRNRFIWHYRWFWDYSGGMMTDWGAHHLDSIHHIMGVEAPRFVWASGGRMLPDNRETPDYFETIFEYPGFVVSYTQSSVNSRLFENRRYGMLFHGTQGTVMVDRSSYEVVPEMKVDASRGPSNMVESLLNSRRILDAGYHLGPPVTPGASAGPKPAPPPPKPLCEPIKVTGISLDPAIQEAHIQDWLDAIHNRTKTVADWETGHRAATACHLGVIAYRTGRRIRWDAKTESIVGDVEASGMLTKTYRAPWQLPRV